jgi:uncharacterized membrane protein YoaK (UPF0700 family)
VNERYPRLQATLLAVVAGMADAVGYITMGGIFTANMTGNTVLAGISLADGHYDLATKRFAPLLSFFLGAMLARLLLRLLHRPAVALLVEVVLIASADFLPVEKEVALMIVALAMGLQASALTHFGGAPASTVVVTSTLARVADATLDRLWPLDRSPLPPWLPPVSMPRLLVLTWIGYIGGALGGGLLVHAVAYPLLVPAGLLLFVVFATVHIGRTSPVIRRR